MNKKLFQSSAKKLLLKGSIFLFVFALLVNLSGCCVYSFTGASVPEHLNTVAIPIANDVSGFGQPGIRESLTNRLIQEFIEDNTLQVSERTNADALLECTIVSLSDAPVVITSGENIQSRRITLGVKVVYTDLVKRKVIFDKTFSNYGDYTPGGNISERDDAIELALDRMAEDILLAVVSGW